MASPHVAGPRRGPPVDEGGAGEAVDTRSALRRADDGLPPGCNRTSPVPGRRTAGTTNGGDDERPGHERPGRRAAPARGVAGAVRRSGSGGMNRTCPGGRVRPRPQCVPAGVFVPPDQLNGLSSPCRFHPSARFRPPQGFRPTAGRSRQGGGRQDAEAPGDHETTRCGGYPRAGSPRLDARPRACPGSATLTRTLGSRPAV